MFSRLFTIPIVIQNPATTTDQYNRSGADWTTPIETTVYGWYDTGLRKMSEDLHNEDQGMSDGTAFLPPNSPVTTVSRLKIQGQIYQVFGVPAIANTPGGTHHIECRIQRFSG